MDLHLLNRLCAGGVLMTHYNKEHTIHPNTRLVIGLVLSLALLGLTYFLVATGKLGGAFTWYVVMGLAFLQALVQLICFLHLGKEASPYWSTQLFIFMLIIMAIIVLGSIWIMHNLNYNMMGYK